MKRSNLVVIIGMSTSIVLFAANWGYTSYWERVETRLVSQCKDSYKTAGTDSYPVAIDFERLQRALLAADRAGDVQAATVLAQTLRRAITEGTTARNPKAGDRIQYENGQYQEGEILANPQTGERIQLVRGEWKPLLADVKQQAGQLAQAAQQQESPTASGVRRGMGIGAQAPSYAKLPESSSKAHRSLTARLPDGTIHTYDNVPDNVTQEQAQARADKEFGGATPAAVVDEKAKMLKACDAWELSYNRSDLKDLTPIQEQIREARDRQSGNGYLVFFAGLIAAISMIPWLWYFLLRRLSEVISAVRGKPPER